MKRLLYGDTFPRLVSDIREYPGKWISRLTFQGKRYYLGRYDTLEKAVAARKQAEAEYFGSFLETYYPERESSDHS